MWEKRVLMIVSVLIHLYENKSKIFINKNLRQKLNKLTDEGIQNLSGENSV